MVREKPIMRAVMVILLAMLLLSVPEGYAEKMPEFAFCHRANPDAILETIPACNEPVRYGAFRDLDIRLRNHSYAKGDGFYAVSLLGKSLFRCVTIFYSANGSELKRINEPAVLQGFGKYVLLKVLRKNELYVCRGVGENVELIQVKLNPEWEKEPFGLRVTIDGLPLLVAKEGFFLICDVSIGEDCFARIEGKSIPKSIPQDQIFSSGYVEKTSGNKYDRLRLYKWDADGRAKLVERTDWPPLVELYVQLQKVLPDYEVRNREIRAYSPDGKGIVIIFSRSNVTLIISNISGSWKHKVFPERAVFDNFEVNNKALGVFINPAKREVILPLESRVVALSVAGLEVINELPYMSKMVFSPFTIDFDSQGFSFLSPNASVVTVAGNKVTAKKLECEYFFPHTQVTEKGFVQYVSGLNSSSVLVLNYPSFEPRGVNIPGTIVLSSNAYEDAVLFLIDKGGKRSIVWFNLEQGIVMKELPLTASGSVLYLRLGSGCYSVLLSWEFPTLVYQLRLVLECGAKFEFKINNETKQSLLYEPRLACITSEYALVIAHLYSFELPCFAVICEVEGAKARELEIVNLSGSREEFTATILDDYLIGYAFADDKLKLFNAPFSGTLPDHPSIVKLDKKAQTRNVFVRAQLSGSDCTTVFGAKTGWKHWFYGDYLSCVFAPSEEPASIYSLSIVKGNIMALESIEIE